MEGIPWYSTFTLATETLITLGILYVFYSGYYRNSFPHILTTIVLGYEILFNISYMASRLMTHVNPPDHVDSAFHIGIAIFHGTFALIMFVALLVFMYFAWRGYARGVNYFLLHKRLTIIFLIAWMTAIFSGFLFYYEAYFSPEELLHRQNEAALNATP